VTQDVPASVDLYGAYERGTCGGPGHAAERPTFDDFVAARGAALMRFCSVLTGTRADAEDLLQESLARCFVRWHKISGVEFVEAYVRRVIVTQHAGASRRRGFRFTALTDDQPSPDGNVDLDLREALRAALQRLPPRQRIVMVLTYLEDLPDSDIAST